MAGGCFTLTVGWITARCGSHLVLICSWLSGVSVSTVLLHQGLTGLIVMES